MRLASFAAFGLPPRGRGNLVNGGFLSGLVGSTPAWAGQPRAWCVVSRRVEVYPRVGGATWCKAQARLTVLGLPPRGRGNHRRLWSMVYGIRSTPAWAGQPKCTWTVPVVVWVYPRVGGATGFFEKNAYRTGGLPPRGRGNHGDSGDNRCARRSTPAWAGQPSRQPDSSTGPGVYPRVGGATFDLREKGVWHSGLPPRGRGNRNPRSIQRMEVRSTPAWAGQPGSWPSGYRHIAVYPRVGGATHAGIPFGESIPGLPPRGRGNPREVFHVRVSRRSTPAWAGQPLFYEGRE